MVAQHAMRVAPAVGAGKDNEVPAVTAAVQVGLRRACIGQHGLDRTRHFVPWAVGADAQQARRPAGAQLAQGFASVQRAAALPRCHRHAAPVYSPRAGSFFCSAKSMAASGSSKCGRANGMVCTAP